ncbi:histidinol dehydrogenase [Ethanoligenens sp.]|uniref:histidinol dehydrogenase n=1 Tax=Ethanoligenens sp. TaxID=2099655 RepID=UPI0039E9D66E
MKILTADGKSEVELLKAMRGRSMEIDRQVTETVQQILTDVHTHGDNAVRDYTEKFDGVRPGVFELPMDALESAYRKVPTQFVESMSRAAENIRLFHERQKREGFITTQTNGTVMGQRVRGLARVGLYVPGGKAAYPSSVLMNAIPAKVAGVGELVMVTPPGKDGTVNPYILAAAKIANVDRVFAVGGAQAIGALAYGTASIPKVDKIVGPGNIFVATAKRLVFGAVDIDMIAGPSEILVVADETADPTYLAADLMSQAEHDPLASAVLLTTSAELAEQTLAEIDRQKAYLSRKEIIEQSLQDFGAVIVCKDLDDCLRVANDIAPEHLELMVEQPMHWLGKVENAGSVFLGKYSPEPLGDYYAGPNHVLPTSGTARFFSPLSVDTFIKKSSFIYYSQAALDAGKDDIILLAEAEGLTAHANSIKVRFDK